MVRRSKEARVVYFVDWETIRWRRPDEEIWRELVERGFEVTIGAVRQARARLGIARHLDDKKLRGTGCRK